MLNNESANEGPLIRAAPAVSPHVYRRAEKVKFGNSPSSSPARQTSPLSVDLHDLSEHPGGISNSFQNNTHPLMSLFAYIDIDNQFGLSALH
jgi:hypothetical protein